MIGINQVTGAVRSWVQSIRERVTPVSQRVTDAFEGLVQRHRTEGTPPHVQAQSGAAVSVRTARFNVRGRSEVPSGSGVQRGRAQFIKGGPQQAYFVIPDDVMASLVGLPEDWHLKGWRRHDIDGATLMIADQKTVTASPKIVLESRRNGQKVRVIGDEGAALSDAVMSQVGAELRRPAPKQRRLI